MPRLRVLSGKEVVKILQKFGFEMIGQRGSHVKLIRQENEENQTLTVPNHHELDRGTTKAIYNQATKYISPSDLRKYFYH